MHQRQDPDRALVRLTNAQSMVVTREQALGLGLSRHSLARLVEQHHWQRLAPGLFLTHSGAAQWDSLAWAGVLLGGDDARLGGRAAAYLGKLVDQPPDPIRVLVPHGQPAAQRACWSFVQERPGARDPRSTGSPPRTLMPDTVLDLCDGATPRQVEDWVSRAVQRQLTTPEHLRRTLVRRPRHSRRALLVDLLADVVVGVESPLELRYLRDVERRHRLPPGRRQRPNADGTTRRDVLYERYRLLVELDGRLGHVGEGQFRDMARDNAALLTQLSTARYGFGDVAGRPCEVAWEVARLLMMRGWPGPFERCSLCPAADRERSERI